MDKEVDLVVKLTLILFMVITSLDMGLRLNLREALAGLKNMRFVLLTVLWGYVLFPALGYLLTKLIPLEQPYAIGMILVAMVPCSAILPRMVNKARGDLSYTAAFMLLTSVVTVAYMSFAVPVLVKGFAADSWTIGKPLLIFLLIPMAIGLAIQSASALITSKIGPFVSKVQYSTGYFLVWFALIVYGEGFIRGVGNYAIGTQILFYSVASAASYWLSPGLKQNQRSVLSLGMSFRNLAAAFAPLFAVQGIDRRAMVMVALGIPIQFVVSFFAATRFGRGAPGAEPAAAQIAPDKTKE